MTWSPDSSTTGAAQTGLTTPTYTIADDLAPDANSRQKVVTALGGTQTGVRVSTAGDPFTATIRRDKVYKALPAKNPVNGSYGNVPMNKTELLIRKGVYIDSSNTVRVANLRVIAELPAGSELADAVNIRAMASFGLGLLAEESADYGDSLVTGVI
jgi:hypothetical protein